MNALRLILLILSEIYLLTLLLGMVKGRDKEEKPTRKLISRYIIVGLYTAAASLFILYLT